MLKTPRSNLTVPTEKQHLRAVFTAFLFAGIGTGVWIARLPHLKSNFDLNNTLLGWAIGAFGVGVIIAMLAAAWVIGKLGSRRVVCLGWGSLATAFSLIAISGHFWVLLPVLFLTGVMLAWMDVAMNELGAHLERQRKRPLLSLFHGGYSLGTLLGALSGAAFAAFNPSLLPHYASSTVIIAAALLLTYPYLPSASGEKQGNASVIAFPPGPLVPLALLVLAVTTAEGVISDWVPVMLNSEAGHAESLAALAYAAFAGSMTLGRFSGNWLTEQLGSTRLLVLGLCLSALGLGVLLLAKQNILMAAIACFLTGLGLSNAVPLMFSRAANTKDVSPSRGIASVACIGYFGILAAPPVVGWIGDLWSLQHAFVILFFTLLLCLVLSPRIFYQLN